MSVGEAIILAATLAVALLAWAGLVLADTGRYGLPAAVGLTVLVMVALVAVAWRLGGWPGLAPQVGKGLHGAHPRTCVRAVQAWSGSLWTAGAVETAWRLWGGAR